MKTEAHSHPKFLRLARLLGVRRVEVLGHMTLLYGWAADYAHDGDITDFADEAVIAADWTGETQAFIDALVECRLLDRTPAGRLVIHDWLEHCPEYVKKRHRRAQQKVAENGDDATDAPRPDAADGPPLDATECRAAPERRTTADNGCQRLPTEPNETEPNPTQSNRTEPNPPAVAGRLPASATGGQSPPSSANGRHAGSGDSLGSGGSGFGDSGKSRQRVSDSDSGQRGAIRGDEREGPPGDRSGGGDESPRGRAALRWLMATERFCCRGSPKQQAADATSARNMFDAFWPDDTDDPAAARKRFDEAMCIVDEIKRRPQAPDKPMAMLTARLKKRALLTAASPQRH